jgi:hypothetical protein
MQIKTWDTKEVIHESQFSTLREVLQECAEQNIPLVRANIRGADLRAGDYTGLKCFDCKFTAAKFDDAVIDDCQFVSCDFTTAKIKYVKSMKLTQFISPDFSYATLPVNSAHITGGSVWPLFISPETVCIGTNPAKSPSFYLNMTDEEAEQFSSEVMVEELPYIKKMIQMSLSFI